MGIFDPETWFNNKTEDKMALITKDEFGFHVDVKWIDPDHHLSVGYRKGIDRIGSEIHFLAHPVNRPDLKGPKVMPSDVFDHSEIDVVYKLGDDQSVSRKYMDGALVGFEFRDNTMFRRIGLVRTIGGIYDSLAKFGNCCYAGSVLDPGQASAPVEAQPLLVVAQVPADPSPHHCSEIGTVTNGAAQAPNPPPNASL